MGAKEIENASKANQQQISICILNPAEAGERALCRHCLRPVRIRLVQQSLQAARGAVLVDGVARRLLDHSGLNVL